MFLHRGIAARQFQRSFILAEGLEVTSAKLEHGLLHIDMVRPQPETRVRTVKIAGAGTNGGGQGAGGGSVSLAVGSGPAGSGARKA